MNDTFMIFDQHFKIIFFIKNIKCCRKAIFCVLYVNYFETDVMEKFGLQYHSCVFSIQESKQKSIRNTLLCNFLYLCICVIHRLL